MDSHYDRREQSELLEEFGKAIDYLTIDPTFRLTQEVQTLRVEKTKMEQLEQRINQLDEMLGLKK